MLGRVVLRTRGWDLFPLTGRTLDSLYNVCNSSKLSRSTELIIPLLQDLVGSKQVFSLFPYSAGPRTSLAFIPSMLPFRLLVRWPTHQWQDQHSGAREGVYKNCPDAYFSLSEIAFCLVEVTNLCQNPGS